MPPLPTLQLWVHFSFPSLLFIQPPCASGKPNVTDVPFLDQSPRVPPASPLMAAPPCGDISCIHHHVSALHGDSSASIRRSMLRRPHCVHFLSYSIVLELWLNINSMEYAFPNILHDKSVTSDGFALLPHHHRSLHNLLISLSWNPVAIKLSTTSSLCPEWLPLCPVAVNLTIQGTSCNHFPFISGLFHWVSH